MRVFPWSRKTILFSLIIPFAATLGRAQDFGRTVIAYTIAGTCTSLIIYNNDKTVMCGRSIARMVYPDGRNSFVFTAGTKLISFSGDIDAVTDESLSLKIDHLTSVGEKGSGLRASGTCQLFIPLRGISHLACRAHTARGEATASFSGDGSPPIANQF